MSQVPPIPQLPNELDTVSRASVWYQIGWKLFRILFKIAFKLKVNNAHLVPLKGPLIIASNHASLLDPPLIGCASPRPLYYLARDSLFKVPVLNWIIRSWNAVAVSRDVTSPKGLKAAADLLEQGKAILIFPEGTRSPDGNLQPAKPGVGLLIAKTAAPVLPVRIFNSYKALPRHKIVPHLTQIEITFGAPISTTKWAELIQNAKGNEKKQLYHLLAQWIMEQIAQIHPIFTKHTSSA